jgi:hypothetical protein
MLQQPGASVRLIKNLGGLLLFWLGSFAPQNVGLMGALL